MRFFLSYMTRGLSRSHPSQEDDPVSRVITYDFKKLSVIICCCGFFRPLGEKGKRSSLAHQPKLTLQQSSWNCVNCNIFFKSKDIIPTN